MPSYANGALLNATGKQGLFAGLTAITISLEVIISLILVPKLGFAGVSIGLTVPKVLLFIPTTLLCHQQLKLKLPWPLAGKILLSCMIMAIATWLAMVVHIQFLIVALLISPVVYFASLSVLSAWEPQEIQIFHDTVAKLPSLLRPRRSS
jgi:O-antigen/teichoic acid export membrane protein